MVSADGLVRGNQATLDYCAFDPVERPIGIQLFGSNPDVMADAARRLCDLPDEQRPDLIDVNMGCPVRKVVKGNAGAALMRDACHTGRLLREMKRAISVPLTVKIRAGYKEGERSAAEMARVAEDCGAAAVAVHPRSRAQGFRGIADWSVIREVKEGLSVPVIGNGDVTTVEAADRMLRETGCDAVMIGRGALMNPFIFNQIVSHRSRGSYRWLTVAEIKAIILEQFHAILGGEPPATAMHKMRTFAGWYSRGVPGGAELRRRLNDIQDAASFLANIEECLADDRLDLDPSRGPAYNRAARTTTSAPTTATHV